MTHSFPTRPSSDVRAHARCAAHQRQRRIGVAAGRRVVTGFGCTGVPRPGAGDDLDVVTRAIAEFVDKETAARWHRNRLDAAFLERTAHALAGHAGVPRSPVDRKSTRLNSSH